jgi:hypothetical protein
VYAGRQIHRDGIDVSHDQTIASHIQMHGWHCLHVAASNDDEDPFSCSIGFWSTFGAPEVLVFGLPEAHAHAVLMACYQRLQNGGTLQSGVKDDSILSGGYPVVFNPLRTDQYDEYLGTAMRHYNDQPFPALVMFLPDRQYRFAWDPGYEGPAVREAVRIVDSLDLHGVN